MVDQRDDNRDDFIINGDFAEEADLTRESYYKKSSDGFQNKSIMWFVIGGLGLVVMVVMVILILSRPKNSVDQEYLESLEKRMQQLEKKPAAIGVMDQIIKRLGKQEQDIDLLDKKISRFDSSVSTQIDQIIKELGALHQKTSQIAASGAPQPKTVAKKQPLASKNAEPAAQFHQVQAGETLFSISRRYGLSVQQLRTYNDLAPNAAIYPGQKLKLGPKPKY